MVCSSGRAISVYRTRSECIIEERNHVAFETMKYTSVGQGASILCVYVYRTSSDVNFNGNSSVQVR